MKPIEQAAQFFRCKEDEVRAFDAPDTFNPPNTLQGFICRIGDHRYGALYITSVSNIPCAPQVVWGTPKQRYPFDKNGRFNWPPCRKVNVYEKLDGTNVCAYAYKHRGREYVTYKTRLTPVVRGGEFGDFEGMWRDMLAKYPGIPKLTLASGMNLSFELYGARNLHLIVYDVPLDAKFLFAITRTVEPRIVDPEAVSMPNKGFPEHAARTECTALNDLTLFYKKLQAEAEALNQSVEMGIRGGEGYVFYAHTEDGIVRQYKAKPETIELIHWTTGGLGKNVIKATVINAFENEDDVTVEFVKELLREEFEPSKIDRQSQTIARILAEVKQDMQFRAEVVAVYNNIGISIAGDKRACLREMSRHFPQNRMRYAYWIVTNCVS